jgi:2,3-bisphosphoglycerate-independent phosphoglycerate mutase
MPRERRERRDEGETYRGIDAAIPGIAALKPTVLIVTGDHSTPAKLRSHRWHPAAVVRVADSCRTDQYRTFSEAAGLSGGPGQFHAKCLMPLALAHAGRLGKYGA